MLVASSLGRVSARLPLVLPHATACVLVLILLPLISVSCSAEDPAQLKREAAQQGDAFLKNEQFAEAMSAYRIALEKDPRDGEIRLRLAEALRGAEQWPQAAAEAIRAADLLPSNLEAQVNAAEGLASLSQFTDAQDRAALVLRVDPAHPRGLVAMANAKARLVNANYALLKIEEALRLKRSVESTITDLRSRPPVEEDRAAESMYRRAVEIAPDQGWMKVGLAGLLWISGRDDEGAMFLKQAADQDSEWALLGRTLGQYYASKARVADAEKYLRAAAATGERESRLVLADFLASHDQNEAALRALREIPSGEQANDVRLRIADIELRRGQFDEVIRWTAMVLTQEPQNALGLRLKAQALVAGKSAPQSVSLAAARAAVAAAPTASDAHVALGQALAAGGEHEAALDEFTEAVRFAPTSAIALRELFRAAFLLNRNTEALEFARRRVLASPTDTESVIDLARVLVRVHEYGEAARRVQPLFLKEAASAPLLALRGQIEAGQGDRESARASYQRALQLDAVSFEAVSGLVALDLEAKQMASAKQRLEKLVSAHPKNIEYLLLAVRVADASGDSSASEAMLKQVIAMEPSNVAAVQRLAEILTLSGRSPEAIRALEQLISRRPASLEARLTLGQVFERGGRLKEAQAVYERILDDRPGTGLALYRLAAIHAAQDLNLDLAMSLAVSAKQQLPNAPEVNDTLGWIYSRKGLSRQAIVLLEAAVQAVPSNPVYRYHAGVTFKNLGDVKKARAEFERALQLDPGFADADRARQALNQLPR